MKKDESGEEYDYKTFHYRGYQYMASFSLFVAALCVWLQYKIVMSGHYGMRDKIPAAMLICVPISICILLALFQTNRIVLDDSKIGMYILWFTWKERKWSDITHITVKTLCDPSYFRPVYYKAFYLDSKENESDVTFNRKLFFTERIEQFETLMAIVQTKTSHNIVRP